MDTPGSRFRCCKTARASPLLSDCQDLPAESSYRGDPPRAQRSFEGALAMRCAFTIGVLGCGLALFTTAARAEELPREYQEAVNKGLGWLAKTQNKDGHWEGNGGQY